MATLDVGAPVTMQVCARDLGTDFGYMFSLAWLHLYPPTIFLPKLTKQININANELQYLEDMEL